MRMFRRLTFGCGIVLGVAIPFDTVGGQYVASTTYRLRSSARMQVLGGPVDQRLAQPDSFTAVVTWTPRGRGRMNIESGPGPALTGGQFVLFDSSEAIVADSSTYTFFSWASYRTGIRREIEGQFAEANSIANSDPDPAPGVTVKVAVDSLGPGEPFEGRKTQRWRVTASLVLEALPDASALLRHISDYVYVDGPLLFEPPTSRSETVSMPVPFARALRDSMVVALKRLPANKTAVTTTTVVEMNAGGNEGMRMETARRIDRIRSTMIDPNSLVLPSGFKEIVPPGGNATGAGSIPLDHGAKWRARLP